MVVLLEGSPISTEELWSSVRVTISFFVTSLTKAHLPRLLSLDRVASSRKSSCGSKLLPLRMMEATVFLGTFNAAPRHNPVSEIYGQFLRPHGLVFALTCTVNCGTLYRQVCAFPNYVRSIKFTTGGLQSSCRNIARMINGNRMHLSYISSLIAKALNKMYVFALSLCGIVCR